MIGDTINGTAARRLHVRVVVHTGAVAMFTVRGVVVPPEPEGPHHGYSLMLIVVVSRRSSEVVGVQGVDTRMIGR